MGEDNMSTRMEGFKEGYELAKDFNNFQEKVNEYVDAADSFFGRTWLSLNGTYEVRPPCLLDKRIWESSDLEYRLRTGVWLYNAMEEKLLKLKKEYGGDLLEKLKILFKFGVIRYQLKEAHKELCHLDIKTNRREAVA